MSKFSFVKKVKKNVKENLKTLSKEGVSISQPASEKDYLKMQDDWQSHGDPLKRFTFYAPIELQERIRNMSFWTRVPVSDIGCYALAVALDDLEKEFNSSFPWKSRPQELQPGRPSKA
tara:strand:+ start:296 stop:649 length:354 start_codon:yes stop_codon:yes gene_type:complete